MYTLLPDYTLTPDLPPILPYPGTGPGTPGSSRRAGPAGACSPLFRLSALETEPEFFQWRRRDLNPRHSWAG